MENLVIPATEGEFVTPYVHFDIGTHIFEMKGESYVEDVDLFYKPIWEWLHDFKETATADITFNFEFSYYNSSSSKAVLRILKILKEYAQKARVTINWHYPNHDLEQEGIDFQDMLEIEINMIQV